MFEYVREKGSEREGQITFIEPINVYMLSTVTIKAIVGVGILISIFHLRNILIY